MKFELTTGLGKIKIGVNGDSFSFIRPLAFCWNDNYGSVGKYLCALPFSQEYRDEIHNAITSNLDVDFSDNIGELHQLLSPLFRLFQNGDYTLTFHNSEPYDLGNQQDSVDHHTENEEYNWELHFGHRTHPKEENIRQLEYDEFLVRNVDTKDFYPPDILAYTTYNFYSGLDTIFLATQPQEVMDWERVHYFEHQIKQGSRPFVLLFNCFFLDIRQNKDHSITDHSIQSDYFVLDGHHKLLAYQKLKLNPPLASLTFLPKEMSEITLDRTILKEYLYSWQLDHIKNHTNR